MFGPRIGIHRIRYCYSALSSSSRFQFQRHSHDPKHLTRTPFHFHSSAPKQDSDDYPTGDFNFEPLTGWKKSMVNLRMLLAFPWERVRHGSVLKIKLRGQISDQLKSRFSRGLSLPEICENLLKAAYDPRISAVYLHIDILNCGWAKVEEIRRHILNFRKSGKLVVAYVPACREKEYYIACACEEIYAPPSAYFSLFGLTVQTSFLRGVLDNIGIEPQVERVGKYKSAGDQLTRRTMSDDNREMLTALLDNIYTNWLDTVSSAIGKKREDIEKFINEGVYQVDRLKEEGFISNIIYDDEVITRLKERLPVKTDKDLPMVDFRKYSGVRKRTVGISGGKELIAIIRASGSIRRAESPLGVRSAGIIGEKFIEKIRSVRGTLDLIKIAFFNTVLMQNENGKKVVQWPLRASNPLQAGNSDDSEVPFNLGESHAHKEPHDPAQLPFPRKYPCNCVPKDVIAAAFVPLLLVEIPPLWCQPIRESNKYKAAIIRIDSPGGDALASDLMWREIRLLAASKPVIASMSDVAASGGYYMAMGAGAIVAESLTLTGSIGVVTGKFNLGKLYEKIGFNKEILSRGRYAELLAAEQRSFRPDEAELFAKSAQHVYKQFRDKAALSRSMTVDKMEEVAQGRVWTGKDAASHGLVDAIGGLSRAIAIAKLKANIPQDRQVTIVELSRPSPSLPEILSGLGNTLVGVDRTLKELLQDLTFSDGVQARVDGIMFQKLEGYPYANPILAMIKDYLSSL
ncbi:Peptidase S49 [Sesbania bispinosa]|nr:Peptidase S49 [Sesbania bispinosa]